MQPAWRSGTRALAMVAGLVIGLALFFSPVAEWAARAAIPPAAPAGSVRSLYYAASVDPLRDAHGYARAHAAAPESHTDLLLMGSSEISAPVPQNPSRFLPEKVSDFDLFLAGRGYTQSLYHAIELAGLADDLNPRRVALIVSPQWFTAGGASSESFKEVFSAAQAARMLDNKRLSPATRAALQRRAGTLLQDTTWFGSAEGRRAALTAALDAPARPLQQRAAVLKIASQASRATATLSKPYAVATRAVPVDRIDWAAERATAAAQGRAAVTNNAFGVENAYFDQYIRQDLASLSGKMKDLDYAADSPEWNDLDLFLAVAAENDVEVLLISVPMSGRWYDYAGYDAQRRTRYYDRLRGVAARHGVQLADFSDREYQDYFLIDIMHLGWRGWLDVIEASVRFARS